MDNLTIVIPYYNGGSDVLERLIKSIPTRIPIIVVNDRSTENFNISTSPNVRLINLERKGYFSGAVNRGIKACNTDVLVLNQDTWFEDSSWLGMLEQYRDRFAFIGERIKGNHPSFGKLGYIHGTFMFMRRDAINTVGLLNEMLYPLWGATAEWQWRVARKRLQIKPVNAVPGFHHDRGDGERYGSSIKQLLKQEPDKHNLLIQTPPLISVVVPCYNYGRYLQDCVNSLIGGETSLGTMPGQTIQSFEIIIVDDKSTDDSWEIAQKLASEEKGIRVYQMPKNGGTARTLNYGIERAQGKYITFLSADDMRETGSLEALYKACVDNPHSFAYDNVWLVANGERIKQWKLPNYDFEKLLFRNHVPAGIMFPKAAWQDVGGYPASMGDGREDWAFNVALGIKGWCGVHVASFGYLYRREGQNRTLTNTTEEHYDKFLGKISSLFPEVYGGHRPMACCGKGGNKAPTMTARIAGNGSTRTMALSSTNIVGSTGMEQLEYQGQKMSSTWTGPVTNASYRFGIDRKIGWVDKRDVGERNKSGFLNMKDSRTDIWLFNRYTKTTIAASPTDESGEEAVVEETIAEEPTQVLVDQEVVELDSFNQVNFDSQSSEPVVESTVPNPTDATVAEMQEWDLTKAEWNEVYKLELAGRHRTTALRFIEEKLAIE